MPIMVSDSSGGSDIEPIPEGMHNAICVALYDLGTIFSQKFNKPSHKIAIMWEFPEEPPITLTRDGHPESLPRCVTQRYTLSLHKKADLRHILESWRSRKFTEEELKGFDIEKILGKQCTIQIIHSAVDGSHQRIYANIENVLPPSKGAPKLQPKTRLQRFSVSDLTQAVLPKDLPEWVSELVMQSSEWKALSTRPTRQTTTQQPSQSNDPGMGDPMDNVPF